MNNKIVKLENGLELVLLPDKNKNRTTATIFIKAGGLDNHFKYGNKEYTQVYGIAHFLEHYLLEKSMYGNAMQLFDNEYIQANGLTSTDMTKFYISTVHDFEENFIKLINVVNNPNFDEDKINDVKKPIISEINRSLDKPNLKFSELIFKTIYHNIPFNTTLGSTKDIKNMKIEDIKLFHEAFYQPSNQMILISGNFDKTKVVKLIKNEYAKLNKKYKKVKRIRLSEPNEVKKKTSKMTDNKEGLLSVIWKIDLSKFSPLEKNKLDYYMFYMLDNNFSEKSKIFRDIIDNKISLYSVTSNYHVESIYNKGIVSLTLRTDNHDKAAKLLIDYLNNLESSDKSFDNFIKKSIIKNISMTEDIHRIADNLIENINQYNYCNVDDLKFINSLSLKECNEMMSKLDCSNISIIKRIRGE
jgi:predicted Zn-dependent peptidase